MKIREWFCRTISRHFSRHLNDLIIFSVKFADSYFSHRHNARPSPPNKVLSRFRIGTYTADSTRPAVRFSLHLLFGIAHPRTLRCAATVGCAAGFSYNGIHRSYRCGGLLRSVSFATFRLTSFRCVSRLWGQHCVAIALFGLGERQRLTACHWQCVCRQCCGGGGCKESGSLDNTRQHTCTSARSALSKPRTHP